MPLVLVSFCWPGRMLCPETVSRDRILIGHVTSDASLREKIVSHQFENLSQQNRILSPPVSFFLQLLTVHSSRCTFSWDPETSLC